MPRFFVSASQIGVRDDGTRTVLILGEDAMHITKSLRMKAGETLCVCDMARREYDCSILSVGEEVLLSVNSERDCDTEPPYRATLYQALVKGDKFDTVVQKAVECGAYRIIPFISDRCVVRLNKKDCEKKVARWQRIAGEAAKQCGRGILPEVGSLLSFDEMLAEASEADIPLFCYEGRECKASLRCALRCRKAREHFSGCGKRGRLCRQRGAEGRGKGAYQRGTRKEDTSHRDGFILCSCLLIIRI